MDDGTYAARRVVEAALAGRSTLPRVEHLFDPTTASVTHVLHDNEGAAIVVDPVLDFDAGSGRVSFQNVESLLALVERLELKVELILETHVHADHLSAAACLRERFGAQVGTGCRVVEVQRAFADLFDAPRSGGGAFDLLFDDGGTFQVGSLSCMALHVPGHTPSDTAYVIGDVLVTGDTIFMPDFGSARADFPGGDAAQLYRSARRLLSLPDETRMLHCHDYPPDGRNYPAWISTVGEQRRTNVHLRDGISETEFVEKRTARDATLSAPALMFAAIQVNVNAGELPPPSANGRRYLKLPLSI